MRMRLDIDFNLWQPDLEELVWIFAVVRVCGYIRALAEDYGVIFMREAIPSFSAVTDQNTPAHFTPKSHHEMADIGCLAIARR